MSLRIANAQQHSRILSVGVYRPTRVVPNSEVIGPINSSDEWIVTRSGIRTRRFADDTESLGDMAVSAAEKALSQAGIDGRDVSLVLLATMSNLNQAPPLSAEVAYRIGATEAGAADIGVACAGLCYGVSMASDAIRVGSARYAVVVGTERMSDIIDPADRSTAFIFGDGAGAVVLGPATRPGIGPTIWGADGSRGDAIKQDSFLELRRDPTAPWPTLRMAGPEVFRWAVTSMVEVAQQALAAAGVTVEDLGAFIPHQANRRITDSLAKSLKLPEHVAVAHNVVWDGNTSAASVPLAMEALLSSDAAHSGDLALLMGFGSGLSYAAQVVELP
ncbi:ketoacyl-ACP synthase III [Solihabitans fulvus]|uniref:Ketoacyl-ACP synthase III n=1 Tax=Solihabitans fulvus TaxID=1892852 RepID=A0A5B2WFP1_9PSEU|nr:beta-ketoacyl-ACP synthase III [Solihabitans fulvus]KAA2250155.1 ketoacyl-ACP synthase III [Solihabitans fulvus]